MGIKDMDIQFAQYLKEAELKQVPPLSTLQLEEVRSITNERAYSEISKPGKVNELKDIIIRGYKSDITLRLYKPEGKPPFPVVLFFHGGGWVFGNIRTYESLCSQIANLSSCAVISVDYNLAPEHKFPEPVEDCYCALIWTLKKSYKYGCDPSRLIVCGDSAGGNLSAVITHISKDRGVSYIGYQLLMYPAVDLSSFNSDSYKLFGKGYGLNKEDVIWCIEQYLNNKDERLNPYVSPLFAKDFSNLPPAYIITAGYDVLRDEGHEYANKLEKAGVSVTVKCYESFIHGFFTMDVVSDAVRPAIVETAQFLKKVFSKLA
jgi:acetyl esterase